LTYLSAQGIVQEMEFDLTQLLRETLENRRQRNSNYSLRALARDLGVAAPRVSRWLSNKEGFSKESALEIALRLGLSVLEAENYAIAAESKFARSSKKREKARSELGKKTVDYRSIDTREFKVIERWYHFAILSLLETERPEFSNSWIAKRLGISVHEVRQAIERLLSLGMLTRTTSGTLQVTGLYFANPSGIPSSSVRKFHRQILQKAESALETQTVKDRDFSTLILAVSKSQIDEAREAIKIFRENFEKKFCQETKNRDAVYALGVQFFRLTNP
jgi:uncharacterized protein (TIGR02147 family)